MTKKTIGYIELEWTCPNCGNKNPGMKKNCGTCGSPQPDSVQFEVGQKRDLLDAQKSDLAAKGSDIHCPYCNTRNTAQAQICIQCGGDLLEGVHRKSGSVLNVAPTVNETPIACPSCATLNPAGSATCSACGASLVKPQVLTSVETAKPATPSALRPWMLLPVAAALALCCLIVGFLFFRTTDLVGVVQSSQWQREIAIEEKRDVTKETWRDQLPGGAKILFCEQSYRNRQDNPAPGAKEVCTTQLVDQGNGAAKVEETCYYEVYADYCKYQALEWQIVDRALAQGADLQPYWPQVNLVNGQREGERTETYTINFQTKDGAKQFTTADTVLFAQLQPGSQWTLSVNTLGAVIDVSP